MKEIDFLSIGNIKVGHAQNFDAATGCTVLICETGARCGIDVRGGGPASRESELLNPRAAADAIHAVLLSGGSAFGLDAAGGVMQYLEEHDIGFDTGVTKVPLVCQSCIFDLGVGSKDIRPDKAMGYAACVNAQSATTVPEGNIGAGTGATVGKVLGGKGMMKSGFGVYAVSVGELKVGALVSVNALGDVYEVDSNRKLAGLLNDTQTEFLSSEEMLIQSIEKRDLFSTNTTIGAVVTNAFFNKAEMNKIAAMAQNGLARTIRPVHTTADGDSVYALSCGEVQADINVVGTLASYVMAKAINRAVTQTKAAYGLKCASDF